jgi:acetyl esterase/lipase
MSVFEIVSDVAEFPAMVQSKAQIDELQARITGEVNTVLTSIKGQYEAAKAQEALLRARVGSSRQEVLDVQDRSDWRFAPLNAPDHSGLAPAWLGLAECDALVDEGIAYADTLRMAGVPVDLEIYRGVIHGFVTMGRAIGLAKQAHADAARALRQAWLEQPMRGR